MNYRFYLQLCPSLVLLHTKLSVSNRALPTSAVQPFNLWSNAGDLPLCRPAILQWSQDLAMNMVYLNATLVIVFSLLFQTSCLLPPTVKVIDVGFNGWKPMEAWHRNIKGPTAENGWEFPSRGGRRRQWYKKLCNASSKRCNRKEVKDHASGQWTRARRRSSGWGGRRRPIMRRRESTALGSQEGRSALGEEVMLQEVSPPILSKQEVQHMKKFILEQIEALKQQSLPPFTTKM